MTTETFLLTKDTTSKQPARLSMLLESLFDVPKDTDNTSLETLIKLVRSKSHLKNPALKFKVSTNADKSLLIEVNFTADT